MWPPRKGSNSPQVGFARRFLLELDAPDTTANTRLAKAVSYFDAL